MRVKITGGAHVGKVGAAIGTVSRLANKTIKMPLAESGQLVEVVSSYPINYRQVKLESGELVEVPVAFTQVIYAPQTPTAAQEDKVTAILSSKTTFTNADTFMLLLQEYEDAAAAAENLISVMEDEEIPNQRAKDKQDLRCHVFARFYLLADAYQKATAAMVQDLNILRQMYRDLDTLAEAFARRDQDLMQKLLTSHRQLSAQLAELPEKCDHITFVNEYQLCQDLIK